jgi:hypothetical protein
MEGIIMTGTRKKIGWVMWTFLFLCELYPNIAYCLLAGRSGVNWFSMASKVDNLILHLLNYHKSRDQKITGSDQFGVTATEFE